MNADAILAREHTLDAERTVCRGRPGEFRIETSAWVKDDIA
jgi:hypothetical protein